MVPARVVGSPLCIPPGCQTGAPAVPAGRRATVQCGAGLSCGGAGSWRGSRCRGPVAARRGGGTASFPSRPHIARLAKVSAPVPGAADAGASSPLNQPHRAHLVPAPADDAVHRTPCLLIPPPGGAGRGAAPSGQILHATRTCCKNAASSVLESLG